jgi:protocatechuate 4,5-dioxygenase alpha chain
LAIKFVGTKPIDVDTILNGYALNKMGHSLVREENRAEFKADEDAYMAKYGLGAEEIAAVKSRSRDAMMALGLNMYFYGKIRFAAGGGGPAGY